MQAGAADKSRITVVSSAYPNGGKGWVYIK